MGRWRGGRGSCWSDKTKATINRLFSIKSAQLLSARMFGRKSVRYFESSAAHQLPAAIISIIPAAIISIIVAAIVSIIASQCQVYGLFWGGR